jgi:hypothetical protein
MALLIGSGHFLGMKLMDIVFITSYNQSRSNKKTHVLEFLRSTLMRSGIIEELKKSMNSIFIVPNLLIQSYSNVIGLTLK